MRKRVILYLLTLALVITSVVPMNMVQGETATEENTTTSDNTENEDSSSDIITGQCGPDTYFEYGKDKVLRISGESEINTKYFKDIHNAGISNKVKTIVMENTITGIADSAFAGFTNLEKVEMSCNMISIGDDAFAGCSKLKSLIIPKPTTYIGNHAFVNCTSLELVCIFMYKGVVSEEAFAGCTGMKSLMFVSPAGKGEMTIPSKWPESLEVLYPNLNSTYYPLYSYGKEHGITMYGLNSGDTSLYTDNYVCYNDGFCVVYGYGELGAMSDYAVNIIVAHGITSFAPQIFNGCTKIETIILPESLIAIEANTFANLTKLKEIVIPMGVESVGDRAFKGCSSLGTITFMNPDTVIGSESVPSTVTAIYGHAGSTAEAYALANGINFEEIAFDEESDVEETITEEIVTVEEDKEEITTEEVTTEEEAATKVEESSEDLTEEETQTLEETSTEGEIHTEEESTTEEVQTEEKSTMAETQTSEEITTEGESQDETTTKDKDTEETTISTENVGNETTSGGENSNVQISVVYDTTTKNNMANESVTTTKVNQTTASATTQVTEQQDSDKKQILSKPIIKKIEEKSYRSVKIIWNKVEGAKSYEVYRATKKNGKYKLLKAVTKTTYTDKKVKAGKIYFYKIKAVGEGTKTEFSKVKKIKVKGTPNKPKITVKKTTSSWSIVWGTINDNSKGIEIYMKNGQGKYKKFTRINTTTNLKKAKKKKGVTGISSSINSLQSGLKYQFKARTYAVVKGKKVYSKWSKIKTLKK